MNRGEKKRGKYVHVAGSVVQGGLVERYTRCENDFCNMSSKQQTAGDLLELA